MKKHIAITSILALFAGSALAGTVINNTYYGGTTNAQDYNGDIVNTIGSTTESVTYGSYYGGNFYGMNPETEQLGQIAGNVVGNITNNLTNVTITGNYIGGNGNNDVSWSDFENGVNIGGVAGTIYNNINSSTINGRFYTASLSAGPKKNYATGTIGAVSTKITDSYIAEMCLSGGGAISKINGNLDIVVDNSTVNELYHNFGTYIGGDFNLTLKNSTVGTYFYVGTGPLSNSPGEAKVAGNINVELSGTTLAKGDIHMGSAYGVNSGRVDGNVTFTLKDSASVTGTVYGREGADEIGGKAIFNVDSSYSAKDALKVEKFDVVNITKGANATFVSFDTAKNGTVLNVNGTVSTSDKTITISEGGSLNLTISADNQIDTSVANNGTFSVTAGFNLVANSKFNIISGELTGNAIKAYGGTVNGNVFKVAGLQSAVLNKDATISVSGNDRVSITEEESGNIVLDMAFNSQNATVNSVSETTDSFVAQLSADFDAVGAYKFDVDLSEGDSVMLSFLIDNPDLKAADFIIYHKGEGDTSWSQASDISGVSYDGKTLSFVVNHFSEYGFTAAVPEPATIAMIISSIVLGFVIYRRRK